MEIKKEKSSYEFWTVTIKFGHKNTLVRTFKSLDDKEYIKAKQEIDRWKWDFFNNMAISRSDVIAWISSYTMKGKGIFMKDHHCIIPQVDIWQLQTHEDDNFVIRTMYDVDECVDWIIDLYSDSNACMKRYTKHREYVGFAVEDPMEYEGEDYD